MTSTNHVMTGAVIALTVKQPAAAIPLAFASHFVLDMLPHWGIHEDNVIKRNSHWLFKTVISIDIPLMIAALIIVPQLAPAGISSWTIFASMAAAVLPDFIWVVRFVKEIRTRTWSPGGWFARWHQKIQWYEHPPGLIVEVLWLLGMTLIVRSKV